MNADRKSTFVAPTPSAYSRELTQRVERLEVLRTDACKQGDWMRIAFIERQIKNTLLEWCDSFAIDIDASDCSELKVCHSPSLAIN